jgi:hypothetical protein
VVVDLGWFYRLVADWAVDCHGRCSSADNRIMTVETSFTRGVTL